MARAPHIVYLLDDLGSGGAQRQAVATATQLHASGAIRASFVTYHPDDFFAGRLDDAGIPHQRIPKRVGLDWGFARRLKQALREAQPDVVHAFMRAPAFWASRTVDRERCGLIASERNDYDGQRTRERLALRTAFRRADVITANAASVAAVIPERFGVPADKVAYVPNGIDLESWDRALEAPNPLDFDPEHVHVGVVGRLVPQKNHVPFIVLLATLSAEARKRLSVWVIGDATHRESTADLIAEAIGANGLTKLVHVVPPVDPIAPVIGALDLLALPSRFEGFPNVVLEAMASRTAVLATAVGDVPTLMEDGVTGRMVPVRDMHALRDALDELVRATPETRAALGAAGRKRVEADYTLEAVATRYAELYERVRRS